MNDPATDALCAAVVACEKTNARYAVIGGVARNAWAPPRATTDLDLVEDRLGRLIEILEMEPA